MEFIESERGNHKPSCQGFLYVKQKNLANGVVSWECEERRFNSCNAKIKVRGEEVVGNVNTHNHAADPCRKETLQIKNAIKHRAIDTDENQTAQQIISTAVTNCSESDSPADHQHSCY
jgi:hypothetical protein